jgi:hypothetical protein
MEYNDDIANDMLQYVQESAPQTEHFSNIATSLAETAAEFDLSGSPLSGDVDRVLSEIVQVIGG